MKTLRSTLTALTLALLLAVPVLAQGGDQGDKVTVTFELTLYGDVPQDQAFGVFHPTAEDDPRQRAPILLLCGQVEGFEPRPDCAGGGSVHAGSLKLERGTRLAYAFVRVAEADPENTAEIFYLTPTNEEGEPAVFEPVYHDATYGTHYRFGPDEDRQVPEMPDTGAGGMAGAGLRPGPAAAVAMALLITAGYARWNRR